MTLKKIRLLIVEDHNLVRQGIINILSHCNDFSVVAEAEDGQTMINKYFEFKPDVVLCDIGMPRMDGMTAANRILSKDKAARIIFLTVHNTDEYIYNAYKIGAVGLIPKIVLKDELIDAIRFVNSGRKYFLDKSEEDLKLLKTKFDALETLRHDSEFSGLTRREKEMLTYIGQGFSSNEIADKLQISRRTVDSYRSAIMSKMGIKTLPKLIRFALDFLYAQKEKTW